MITNWFIKKETKIPMLAISRIIYEVNQDNYEALIFENFKRFRHQEF